MSFLSVQLNQHSLRLGLKKNADILYRMRYKDTIYLRDYNNFSRKK